MSGERISSFGIWHRVGWVIALSGLALLTVLVGHPGDRDSGIAPLATALAGDPWLIGLRWTLLGIWVALVLGTGWSLTRPVGAILRWLMRLVLLVLMTGLLLPPDLLRGLLELLAAILPMDSASGTGPDIQVFGHFGLFAALSVLLFATRADLGWLRLIVLLAALACVSELMQLFVEGRTTDLWDVLVDLAGVGVGALLVAGGALLRRRLGASPERRARGATQRLEGWS